MLLWKQQLGDNFELENKTFLFQPKFFYEESYTNVAECLAEKGEWKKSESKIEEYEHKTMKKRLVQCWELNQNITSAHKSWIALSFCAVFYTYLRLHVLDTNITFASLNIFALIAILWTLYYPNPC